MHKLTMYQVDTFSNELFHGNPAAVIPLEKWLNKSRLQNIATENNLSETAFFVFNGDGYHLRWFTPNQEVPLCGHATLASAFVIFNHLRPELNTVSFDTLSGNLSVNRHDDMLVLDFPRYTLRPCEAPETLLRGFNIRPRKVFKTVEDPNYYGIYAAETDISALKPNLAHLEKLHPFGVVVTAPGETSDFVSRYFAPGAGIPEDPVTGSIHCGLIPYWSEQFGRKKLFARQLSARGGELHCELSEGRVSIGGKAVLYLEGTIYVQ